MGTSKTRPHLPEGFDPYAHAPAPMPLRMDVAGRGLEKMGTHFCRCTEPCAASKHESPSYRRCRTCKQCQEAR